MVHKKNLIIVAAATTLAVLSPAFMPADYAIPAGMTQCQAKVYKNMDYSLDIPGEYNRLVNTKILKMDPYGKLFTVSEQKSIDAAKARNYETDGAGWLFSIARINDDKLHIMLRGEMSGSEVFAMDGNGNYFVLYRPTDVRLFRESDYAMKHDDKQWNMLTEWVRKSVRDEFIKSNPGLEPVSYDNSTIGMMMANILYRDGIEYTISTNEYGPLKPNGVIPNIYAESLIRNVRYDMVDKKDTPDGEYVVLSFPQMGLRFDFFLLDGKENYVREVRKDGSETLYRGTFDDSSIRASKIMQLWYNELATVR